MTSTSTTLTRTGPVLLKEAVVQFPHPASLSFLPWQFLGKDTDTAILTDLPGNSDWSDNQVLPKNCSSKLL